VRGLFIGVLLLTGCRAVGAPHSATTAELRGLASIEPLRDWFKANEDRTRFIALLSPT